jgi:hypothetical protein
MSADQEYSGDYGYDLAHEVAAVDGEPGRLRGHAAAAVSGVPFEIDPNGDLGYDSAHGS